MGIYTDGEWRKNRDGIESQLNKQIEVAVPSAPAEVPSIETPAEKRRIG